MTANRDDWFFPIWSIHDQHFKDPWLERVRAFNREAKAQLMLPHEDCSPPWFNGDIENLEAGKWVLVVSLNPHVDPSDNRLAELEFSSEDWWLYWCTFNRDKSNWKNQFFPRLTRLAASTIGIDLPQNRINQFASERMLFVEFCPYASGGFPSLGWPKWKKLAHIDPGINIARSIREIIFNFGQPALVLCNGVEAAYDVKDQQFDIHGMIKHDAALPDEPNQTTWLYSGFFTPTVGEPFQVLGFRQLGRRKSSPKREVEIIWRFVLEEDLLIQQE